MLSISWHVRGGGTSKRHKSTCDTLMLLNSTTSPRNLDSFLCFSMNSREKKRIFKCSVRILNFESKLSHSWQDLVRRRFRPKSRHWRTAADLVCRRFIAILPSPPVLGSKSRVNPLGVYHPGHVVLPSVLPKLHHRPEPFYGPSLFLFFPFILL